MERFTLIKFPLTLIILPPLFVIMVSKISIKKPCQCLQGNITFDSQEQIDHFSEAYAECTEILGNVNITGADIQNLNGLSKVQKIRGFLPFSIPNN